MSSGFRQTRVMLRANLFSLRQRLAISLSMILSITLVVCVLAGFLSIAAGFERVLQGSGSQMVAVVLGGGARQETGSELTPETLRGILVSGGEIGVARDESGNLLASREVVVMAEAPSGGTTLALRGMDAAGPGLRDGITVTAGGLPGRSPASPRERRSGLAPWTGGWWACSRQMAVPLNRRSGPILAAFRPSMTARARCKA